VRRAANVDANQKEIVAALRKIGATVEIIGKPLDLLVCYQGETSLVEIKNKDGFNRLTPAQKDFLARWPGTVHIVRNVAEAIGSVTLGYVPF
jgi:hypothetical protein